MFVGFLFRVHCGVDWWGVVMGGVILGLLVGLGLGDFGFEIWWVVSLRGFFIWKFFPFLENTPIGCINFHV